MKQPNYEQPEIKPVHDLSQFHTQWIAFKTIVVREIRRFLRVWPQTLLPSAITITLYFIIFGSVIGSRVGTMEGYDYMTYIVPGLVMMSVIINSFTNVAFSFFSSKFQRDVEELLVSPASNWVILAGYVCGGVTRGLLTGIIVMMLGLFFTNITIAHIGITLLTAIMTAFLFAMGGFVNAVFARKFDDVSIVPTFILTPLTYLGGVFYSIEVLPSVWQKVSLINPILYQVNAFRYGILGISSGVNIATAFLVMTIAILLLGGYCLYLLNSGKGLRS
ncbi:Inner membrane transport permease YadH [invertebrate metagenome]|uniref:Inner membrane transport permease YadH n=1 Tax=invertebrate metagenome TaxID=1711999 RepID=A0A2H9T3R3_9ZZZZ